MLILLFTTTIDIIFLCCRLENKQSDEGKDKSRHIIKGYKKDYNHTQPHLQLQFHILKIFGICDQMPI